MTAPDPTTMITETDIHVHGIDLFSLHLTPRQFERITRLTYQISGIDLHDGKQELVKARLIKRLRALHLTSYEAYLKYLDHDHSGLELVTMVDVLTTNKTHFFRESEHLEYLRRAVVPRLNPERIMIWSAGCSSGEEPYSIAMTLRDCVPEAAMPNIRILATDISDRMLRVAREGVYDEDMVRTIPPQLKHRNFQLVDAHHPRKYRVAPPLRSMVHFAKLNLMGEWPMAGPFDVIFCRNVMIYFDRPTQERLVERFWGMLSEDGHLMVGHSESLTFLSHRFAYLKPAVYQRIKPGQERARHPAHRDKHPHHTQNH